MENYNFKLITDVVTNKNDDITTYNVFVYHKGLKIICETFTFEIPEDTFPRLLNDFEFFFARMTKKLNADFGFSIYEFDELKNSGDIHEYIAYELHASEQYEIEKDWNQMDKKF